MMKQQVYIYPGSDHVFQALLDDARNVDGIQIVDSIFSNNSIESKILQTKSKHKYLWKLFGQQVLKHHVHYANGLKNIKVGSIVVFSNISVRFLPVSFLKNLKNQGIKLVAYFIDSISNINAKEAFRYVKLGIFDAVFTFDKEDAKRYGFTHFYTMYSRHYNFPEADSIDYDAVYIGSDKGRYNMLTELKAKCQHANLYIDMLNISEKQLKDSGFQSNKSIRYVDSLKIVQKSNCIIDLVLDPEQSGLSLRAYEAIAFNKKLITNNRSILEFPFYNPKYMFYFKDINGIDEDFIKTRMHVDYGYNDEYSPLSFVQRIREMLSNEK